MTQTKRTGQKNLVAKDQTAGKPAVAPKIQYRDQIQVDTHCFKALVAVANRYDKWASPSLRQIEHCHFFHSKNSMGMDMTHTNQVNGHLHAVTWSVDQDGNLVAKCGPALKKVTKQLKNGTTKSYLMEIRYSDDNGETHLDRHTHEMVYTGSTLISQQKIQEIRQANAAVIGNPGKVIDKSETGSVQGYDVSENETTTVE